jgi:hypothetical protein
VKIIGDNLGYHCQPKLVVILFITTESTFNMAVLSSSSPPCHSSIRRQSVNTTRGLANDMDVMICRLGIPSSSYERDINVSLDYDPALM